MKSKRLISLLLSVILFVIPLSACTQSENSENDYPINIEVKEAVIPSEKRYDGSTAEYINVKYGDLDYAGYTFRILANNPGYHYYYLISDQANEIWYEEDSAEVQQHAVFTRNILTEDLINITIEPTWGGDAYEMYDRAKIIAQAGIDEFDLCETSHFRGFLSGMIGYYQNLYDIDTFDINAYWWNQEYVDCYTHDFDKLPTITGDCLIFDDLAPLCTYYNTAVVENYNLPDLSVLVENGEWTIAKEVELASAVTNDTDGDSQMTANDTWGILGTGMTCSFFAGCGIRLAEKDENDVPYLAAENETVINAVEYIYNNIVRSGLVCCEDQDTLLDNLKDDRGLFMSDSLSLMFGLRDMESDFSLLPLPKYNLDQKRYSSVTSGAVTTIIAVPITVRDTGRVGNILNVYGGFSTDTIDQTLNEVILGAKLVRNKRTVEMLRYVIESKYYDWASDLKWAFPIYKAMGEQDTATQFFFVSSLKSVARESKSMLKMLLMGYDFY